MYSAASGNRLAPPPTKTTLVYVWSATHTGRRSLPLSWSPSNALRSCWRHTLGELSGKPARDVGTWSLNTRSGCRRFDLAVTALGVSSTLLDVGPAVSILRRVTVFGRISRYHDKALYKSTVYLLTCLLTYLLGVGGLPDFNIFDTVQIVIQWSSREQN